MASHLQEVVLYVAIEGAAQADQVVLPAPLSLQVQAELRPAVLQLQAKGRRHLQEHRRELLDMELVCKWVQTLDFVVYMSINMFKWIVITSETSNFNM